MNIWQWLASITFLAPLLSWRGLWQHGRMPTVGEKKREERRVRENALLAPPSSLLPPPSSLPSLSIIIPARNEAHNLRRLLPSLAVMCYPGVVEVIVVDDGSVDETAVIAHQHHSTVLQLQTLPHGWLGKTNACHQAAQKANGDWLLFTDADTIHTPDGATAAMQYALQHNLDALSLFLSQKTDHWLVKLVLATAFAGLFAGLRQPVFNGQYILVRRQVYLASQGFAAVRGEPLEDLAFGHHLRQLGYKVGMAHGETAASVQMYQELPHLWLGMTRISSGSLKWSGAGAWVTMAFITAVMTPLLVLAAWAGRKLSWKWVVWTWGTAVLSMSPWSLRAGVFQWSWLSPIAALVIQAAGCWGLVRQFLGYGLQWKGRVVAARKL